MKNLSFFLILVYHRLEKIINVCSILISVNNDQRMDCVSITLVLLILLATSIKTFIPFDTYNTFSSLMAKLYGYSVVFVVFYFIYMRFFLHDPKKILIKVMDFLLLINLIMTNISFLLLIFYASISPCLQVFSQPLIGDFIAINVWCSYLLFLFLVIDIFGKLFNQLTF